MFQDFRSRDRSPSRGWRRDEAKGAIPSCLYEYISPPIEKNESVFTVFCFLPLPSVLLILLPIKGIRFRCEPSRQCFLVHIRMGDPELSNATVPRVGDLSGRGTSEVDYALFHLNIPLHNTGYPITTTTAPEDVPFSSQHLSRTICMCRRHHHPFIPILHRIYPCVPLTPASTTPFALPKPSRSSHS